MADAPVRKADLDKEGISLDGGAKADLDREGILLEEGGGAAEAPLESTPAQETAPEEAPTATGPFRKRIVIVTGIAAACVFVLIVTAAVVSLTHREPPPPSHRPVARAQVDDGIVLDPFMVFYEANGKNGSGVLLAQVSLKVDPAAASRVTGRLYDIRNIIYRRLRDAASVYSQTEIALMLTDDLGEYPIQEVAFLRYQAR